MTIDSSISDCISRFISEISDILGNNLLSAYLYGSVTLNDYKDGWSDIDFICFTSEPLLPSETEKLLTLRQSLAAKENNLLFRKIEGAVISFEEFAQNRYSSLVYWGTSGQRITNSYFFDVFSMFELMKYGKLIYGKDIRNRLSLPSYDDLVSGVRFHYETIRKYAQEAGESIYSCGWLLDIARCLYTLRTGDIISKTEAGRWALTENLCPCADDMKRTLAVRNNPAEYMRLDETKNWLCTLGPSVQTFADVLEKALILKA